MKLIDELSQTRDKNKILIEEKNLNHKDFESHKVLLKK